MGTRGYIVIKFHNRYYKIYNHYDSYPSNLGKQVVDMLKRLKEYNELEQSENCLNTIIENFNKEKVEDGDQDLNIFIEWVYNINLDEMTLTIMGGKNHAQKYNILDIDDDWLSKLNHDEI
jgi:hypothetical protein